MGISANQARLMTLTARQHDLELRAQQISAQKMVLSLQSQQWATDYSSALNNYTILKTAEDSWKGAGYYKIDEKGNVSYSKDPVANDDEYRYYSSDQDASLLASDVASLLGLSLSDDKYNQNIEYNENYLNKVKATYDAKTSSVSSQEKLLDLELTQINTEHSAVKTEYDSVKSLVSDNVDKSFNVFG